LSGSNIYVLWKDNSTGNTEIYFKRSTDNGATWDKKKRLSHNAGYSSDPAIAVSGENIHVVWSDDTPGNRDVYYRRSRDNGITWSKQKRLTNNAGDSSLPTVAASGSYIHVTWYDDTAGNDEIYYKRSTDNGVTWSKQKRLTQTVGGSWEPVIAVSGNNIHLVYSDNTPGNSEIYYTRSTNNGATWRKAKRLTKNAGLSLEVDIAVSGNNIHVVWKDHTPGNAEIFYRRSIDNGVTWGKKKRLTRNAGASAFPSVSVRSNKVYVVWEDDSLGNTDIYYRRSVNKGVSWGNQKRISKNAGSSRIPDSALSSSNIHVVWQDYTPGNMEIYYKRGP
jgi:hypothetical protein